MSAFRDRLKKMVRYCLFLARCIVANKCLQDLWDLPEARRTASLADAVERNYYARCPPGKRPFHMREVQDEKASSDNNEKAEVRQEQDAKKAPLYDESLFKAVYQTFKRRILGAGLLLVLGGVLTDLILRSKPSSDIIRYSGHDHPAREQGLSDLAY